MDSRTFPLYALSRLDPQKLFELGREGVERMYRPRVAGARAWMLCAATPKRSPHKTTKKIPVPYSETKSPGSKSSLTSLREMSYENPPHYGFFSKRESNPLPTPLTVDFLAARLASLHRRFRLLALQLRP